MSEQKHAGGRPPLYTKVEDLEKIINEYFDWCDNRIQQVYDKKSGGVIEVVNPAPYTMAGLARRLGMERWSLANYAKKDKFSHAIKEARNRVQEDVEMRLMETAATGAIFNLKNNFGYKDQTQVDGTTKFIVETRQVKRLSSRVIENESDDDNED